MATCRVAMISALSAARRQRREQQAGGPAISRSCAPAIVLRPRDRDGCRRPRRRYRSARSAPAQLRAAGADPYVSITKKTLDSGDYGAALKRAAELIGLPSIRARQKQPEADGRLIGVGFASFYEQTAYGTGPFGYAAWGIELVPGMEPAVARLTGDGELILEVGSHSHGQGHETVSPSLQTRFSVSIRAKCPSVSAIPRPRPPGPAPLRLVPW